MYVGEHPGPGRKVTISTSGGTDPLWRRDGRQLYYRLGDLMMVVDVSYGRSLEVSKPRVLWRGNYPAGAGSSCGMAGPTSANYDVTPDGERFLMIEDASPNAECALLRVVSNWSLELKNQAAIQLQSFVGERMLPLCGLGQLRAGVRARAVHVERTPSEKSQCDCGSPGWPRDAKKLLGNGTWSLREILPQKKGSECLDGCRSWIVQAV